jgi:SpoVK/Ycf46/Vps4 family AAA+-type ATPase
MKPMKPLFNPYKKEMKHKDDIYLGYGFFLSSGRDPSCPKNAIYHILEQSAIFTVRNLDDAFLAVKQLKKLAGFGREWYLPLIMRHPKKREMFEKIKAEFQYPRRLDGKYDDIVSDKLRRKDAMVYYANGIRLQGEYITDGLMRVHITDDRSNARYCLYHYKSGTYLVDVPTWDDVDRFLDTTSFVDWSKPALFGNLVTNTDFINYFGELLHTFNSNRPLPPIPVSLRNIQFDNVGDTDNFLADPIEYIRVMYELNRMVGLTELKREIDQLLRQLKGEALLRKEGKVRLVKSSAHMIFAGPPGTGKTEVAKLMARLLKALGRLSTSKCVFASRSDLIGEYIGHTAPKVKKKVEEALNGVLFIDEAYALVPRSHNDYGHEAVAQLILEMENHRDNLVVILAGYEADMQKLLEVNEGFRSRIKYHFHFQDYTPSEITEICRRMLTQQGYDCSKIMDTLERAVKANSVNGAVPGNARWARSFVEAIVGHLKVRVGEEKPENPNVVLPIDVERAAGLARTFDEVERLEDVRKVAEQKLMSMVGMNDLKQEIKKIMNYILAENERAKRTGSVTKPNLHMVFYGPPGTGKTTVARIIGEYLRGMGILSNGHFVEATRKDLVGQYLGETAPKVRNIVQKAMGGILFIDEAYALCAGGPNDYGQEAVDALIKEMEDNRDKFVVILAGYEADMKRMLDMNEGFRSRIAYEFYFDNYRPEDIHALTLLEIEKQHLTIDEETSAYLKAQIALFASKNNGVVPGNGRWARTFVEKVKIAQSNRLVESGNMDDLWSIKKEDIDETMNLFVKAP